MRSAAITRGYSNFVGGQVHWRVTGERGGKPDLVCLHPAPFSGIAFATIMPFLGKDRRVIAPDFPGHGGSDQVSGSPKIAGYAEAIESILADVERVGPIDLFGFHTGCLVACEMALRGVANVRRLVLVDVPAFDAGTRAQLLETSAAPPGFTPELQSLAPAWDRGITKRIESQGMARSFEMFVEQLHHGEAMNAGFEAAFSYALEDRLSQVRAPTTIIATQSILLDATRRTVELISNSTLIERLDIKRAVLDEAAEETAAEVLRALA